MRTPRPNCFAKLPATVEWITDNSADPTNTPRSSDSATTLLAIVEFAIQSSVRGDTPLAVLMMDMDGVKQINDTHGHIYGAHVIGETGRLIAKVLGSSGQACRFGGDEFSAFLPGHNLDSAWLIGERIRRTVESARFEKNSIALRPTISIGVSCYPNETADSLSLITTADAALYRSKAQGKNCVTV